MAFYLELPMTDKDKLMELVDAYAEARHIQGHSTYNIKTAAARQAVIEALSGVQALSAAPVEVQSPWSRALEIRMAQGWKLKGDRIPVLYTDTINGEGVGRDDLWLCTTKALTSPTPPAEQQAITPETGNSVSAQGAAITSESGTPPAEQHPHRCRYCDGTGDVHSGDGEWRGICTECEAGTALHQQAVPKAAPGVGNSGFDHQTAADFLSGKTVSDEAVRKFVAASRWAHDERAALSATLLAMHGVLTSREAEIALLKKALLEAEAAPQQEAQEPTEIPEEIERMAADRYKVVPSHESMFHRWAVVAGTGTQQLYLGREVECQNMARKFAGAFLDGAFVAMQSTSPNPAPAPLSDDVVKDAARYRWLREGNDAKHGAAWHVAVNLYGCEWDAAIDAALAAQGGKA